MLSFDEKSLVGELGALSKSARVAFAAAAATRQLGSHERICGDAQSTTRPREITVELWTAMQSSSIDEAAWSEKLEEVMALLPEDDVDLAVGQALADDALSSLAYAIRCLLKPEPQEAAWAARRAYEAADEAAVRWLGVQPGLPNAETAATTHVFVQRELARQRHDLSLLRSSSVDEVKRNSFDDELLSAREAKELISLP